MKKSDIKVMPEYFDRYINLVDDIDLFDAFAESVTRLDKLNVRPLLKLGDSVYAPGKWTIRDIFQHLIDVERIFAYRALRFARKDQTPLPGFEENDYAVSAHATRRSLESLVEELKAVRISNTHLFSSFDDEMLQQVGICFNKHISVLAMGFNIIGHQKHHLNVIDKLYIPLLENNA